MNARDLDPYTYPGTDVLRNIPDIRDLEQLGVFEADSTTARLVELHFSPLKGRFDVGHLRAIHKFIFQMCFGGPGSFAATRRNHPKQLR
jgi:fido (protein-threonine AMPylation protein)